MILITGSHGFIGAHLTDTLRQLGREFIEINSEDGGVTNHKYIEKLRQFPISHVIHLAGLTYVPNSWKNPAKYIYTNVSGTQNILDLCRQSNASLTYVSAYAYGTSPKNPISEEQPLQPNSPYALSKSLAEQVCQFYRNEFAVQVNIIRPFNIFGAGQKKHFLIPTIIDQALYSDAIQLKDLHPRRDYVYITDLIESLILSMEFADKNGTYNIGSGLSLSVAEVAHAIMDILGVNKPLIATEEIRQSEISDTVADISKAKNELGWEPKYSFADGIKEIVSNMKKIQ